MTVTRRIVRSTGLLAGATGISRILGFVRDILIASLFGTSAQAQAFVVAFRLPNMLRDLVAEGAVASAIVPGLSWHLARGDRRQFWRVSQGLLTKVAVVLCLLGLAGAVWAPQIVALVAPGFLGDPELFGLTVRLTRLLFPFITLVGFWAYFMGVLNTLGHFTLPALGPAVLNVAMIVGCLVWAPRMHPGILAVAWAVLLGGVVQLAIQVPEAMRRGFRFRWRWRDPDADAILRLLGPRMVGSAVYQANVLLDTILASLGTVVGLGAVAALYYANRLVQLPLALFGTAFAQASLPVLAQQAAAGDLRAFAATLRSVLRMVAFVMLPAAAGLALLAGPIVRGLLERGAFDARASAMTATALGFYALGLLAFAVNKVVTGAFYALHDTWTPVRLAVEVVAMNLVLSLLLMWPMKIGGLALAAAVTSSVNAYRLTRRLERRLGEPLLAPLRGAAARMIAAAGAMGGGCLLVWHAAGLSQHPVQGLVMVIPAGMAGYGLACRIAGVEELGKAMRWLRQPRATP